MLPAPDLPVGLISPDPKMLPHPTMLPKMHSSAQIFATLRPFPHSSKISGSPANLAAIYYGLSPYCKFREFLHLLL